MDSPLNAPNEVEEDESKKFNEKGSNHDQYKFSDDPVDSDEKSKLMAGHDTDTAKSNMPKIQQTSPYIENDMSVETSHNQPLLDKKDRYSESSGDVHTEAVPNDVMHKQSGDTDRDENIDDQDENLSSSESYPASSHHTENTDSVTGGFGLSNRVRISAVNFD